MVQGGEDEGELQPPCVEFTPLLGEWYVLGGRLLASLGSGHGALFRARRSDEEGVEERADSASCPLLVEGVQDVVGEGRELVGGSSVGAASAERIVAECVEEPCDRGASLRPGSVGDGGVAIGPEPFLVLVECALVLEIPFVHVVRPPGGLASRQRVPGVQQLLLEGPGTEVVDLRPVPQASVVDEHGVQPVRGGTYDVQGGGPPFHVLVGELQSSLPGEFGDLVGLQLVKPGVGDTGGDERGRGGEHLVELHLYAVGLVDDDDVAAQAGQLQIAQALGVELTRNRGLDETGRVGHPDQRVHEVTGGGVPGADAPQWAGVRGAQVLLVSVGVVRGGLPVGGASGLFELAYRALARGLLGGLLAPSGVKGTARRVGVAQGLGRVECAQGVQRAGGAEVGEDGSGVSQ
ncbi:hypothetical protein RKD24_001171 [Streptomyces calvus]